RFSRDWSSDVCSSDLKKPAKATKVRHTTTTSTVTIRWKKPKRAKRVVVCLKTRPKAKRCVRSKKTRGTKVTFRKLTPRKGADYRSEERRVGKEGGTGA